MREECDVSEHSISLPSPAHPRVRIAFIGSGVMAEAMISGLLSRQVVPPEHIWASGPRPERAVRLAEYFGIRAGTDNREAVVHSDVVVLCVKPQVLPKVLLEIREVLRPEQLVMSVIAGARAKVIGQTLAHPAVVRCMPNLPCQIHRGMTIWMATPEVGTAQREFVRKMLQTMGKELEVHDELDVDRATAVNGTGPAIIAHFVKALEDGANFIGESRPMARQSVLQTIIGTAEMILASERHIAELIDGVTSPGGTTSRALHVLQRGQLAATVTDAIDAAFQRSVELGTALEHRMATHQDEKP